MAGASRWLLQGSILGWNQIGLCFILAKSGTESTRGSCDVPAGNLNTRAVRVGDGEEEESEKMNSDPASTQSDLLLFPLQTEEYISLIIPPADSRQQTNFLNFAGQAFFPALDSFSILRLCASCSSPAKFHSFFTKSPCSSTVLWASPSSSRLCVLHLDHRMMPLPLARNMMMAPAPAHTRRLTAPSRRLRPLSRRPHLQSRRPRPPPSPAPMEISKSSRRVAVLPSTCCP